MADTDETLWAFAGQMRRPPKFYRMEVKTIDAPAGAIGFGVGCLGLPAHIAQQAERNLQRRAVINGDGTMSFYPIEQKRLEPPVDRGEEIMKAVRAMSKWQEIAMSERDRVREQMGHWLIHPRR